jgi:hypothetical protein
MPITEEHIRDSARLLLMQYGERAATVMRRRTRELAARGDAEGAEVWRRILAAIASMRGDAVPAIAQESMSAAE